MASNTSIRIKRSSVTDKPSSLLAGELGYSYLSNTIFIGSPDGTGVVNIGGQFYTSQIDSATDTNVANTIVRRDGTGNASFNYISANIIGNMVGNANSATQLLNARDFSISGGDITAGVVSFDGTNNVTLNASLDEVAGLTAGTYGGETAIPVVTVAANGRVMSIANTTIATSFTITGNTGTDTFNGGETLSFLGNGSGVVTEVSNGQVVFGTDTTVVRSNTVISKQTIDGDVEISGNLTVIGTETIINVDTLNIADPLLYLAGNNYTSDIVDIGFVANYNDGTNRHTGVIRHAGTKEFYIFDNYTAEPDSNVIDLANNDFRTANVNAGYFKGNLIAGSITANSLTLTSALGVPSGGTGASTFTAGQVVIGDGTNSLKQLANVSSVNSTLDANSTVSNLTTDVYGRVTSFTTQSISGLTVPQGGTGQSSFTDGAILVGNGSGALQTLANTGTAGTYGSSTQIPVITTDAYGRVSSVTTATASVPELANGSYYLSISSTNGQVSSNGAGFLLKNGAVIKDTVDNAVAFGENAGTIGQGAQAVAIGDSAGYNSQGAFGVAIGYGAGNQNQSQVAVAIGLNAGMNNQGYNGIAIGNSAGSAQGTGAIAFGYSAGSAGGNYSIAIGQQAGAANTTSMGADAIAIGRKAGFESAYAGSIILNASGNDLSSTAAGLYINPVRYTAAQDATYDGIIFYNSNTKEVRYCYALDGGTF